MARNKSFQAIYGNESREVQTMARSIRRKLNKAEREDCASHGANTGWAGFTYYKDTVKFYNRHETAIWELLENDAQDQGMGTLELMGTFGGAKDVFGVETLKNLLTWYALEKICHMEMDANESQ